MLHLALASMHPGVDMTTGSHACDEDPRNATVRISVNGELLPRPEAKVSVLDAGFLLGDGVWESLRYHRGTFLFLDRHLDRLLHGAAALEMDVGRTREELVAELERTVRANDMDSGVHVRLIVSRGMKITPYQDPAAAASGATLVIIPEWKEADAALAERGLHLVTVDVIRPPTSAQDPRLNSLSKHNCIAACIDARRKGGQEGIMLDPRGYVATCNSTHFFVVRGGEVWTSTGEFCLDGITRRVVLELCDEHGIPSFERDFTVEDVHTADEAFVTGTFGGITPANRIDDVTFQRGPVTQRLQELYAARVERECDR
jgi:branched-chain amino acid aminotransferase